MVELTINGQPHRLEVEDDMPLLWALREQLGLTGTKFGCGIGACGACTVHVDGAPARSCLVTVAAVAGRAITTIEGLGAGGLHPLQQAWIARNVPQCGYCQSGQIMTAAALLAGNSAPSDAEIDQAMAGNLCRCGTYQRIRQAIRLAADGQRAAGADVPAGERAP
jgi:isoquinoline 1-oxidoreductase alpha subunit